MFLLAIFINFWFLLLIIFIFGIIAFYVYIDLIIKEKSFIIKNFAIDNDKTNLNKISFLLPIIEIKATQKLPLPNIQEYKEYLNALSSFLKADSINVNVKNLPKIDLSNRDLKYAVLEYIALPFANLQNVNFKFADLKGSNLQYANLQKSNFQNSFLNNANLQSTILENTNFSFSSLVKVNLKNVQLINSNFFNTDLSYANLSNTLLRNVSSNRTNYMGANFSYSKVYDSNFSYSTFYLANLQYSKVYDSNLSNCDFYEADLSEILFWSVDSSYSNYKRANLEEALLIATNFKYALFFNTSLDGIKLYKTSQWGNSIVVDPFFNDNIYSLEKTRRDIVSFFKKDEFKNFNTYFNNTKDLNEIQNLIYFFGGIAYDAEKNITREKAKIILLKYLKYWIKNGKLQKIKNSYKIKDIINEYKKLPHKYKNILDFNDLKIIEEKLKKDNN